MMPSQTQTMVQELRSAPARLQAGLVTLANNNYAEASRRLQRLCQLRMYEVERFESIFVFEALLMFCASGLEALFLDALPARLDHPRCLILPGIRSKDASANASLTRRWHDRSRPPSAQTHNIAAHLWAATEEERSMDIRQRILDGFSTLVRPSPETMQCALAGLGMTLDDLRPYLVEPAGYPYGRQLLYWSPEVEVLVMNWAPETACEPHDHANSFGCVAVIAGVATHTPYRTDPQEGLVPERPALEPAGTILSVPVGLVHTMGNPYATPLVTLHVYSPPITGMRVFDLAQQLEYVVTDDCGAWIPANDAKIVRCTALKGEHDAQAA